jgi:hypothetical protein
MVAFLKGLFGRPGAGDSGKLGSNSDPVRQLLFGLQSLQEQVKHMRVDGKSRPGQSIADAQRLVEVGKLQEAIECLRGVLDSPTLETRMQLWVWSALRELGENPDPKFAYEVLGVVVEMPQQGSYDTLAGYVDGSARYLNFSGKAIFWDAADAVVKRLCQALVDSTIPAGSKAKPRTSLSLPKRGIQATMLTRSGPFVITDVPKPVVDAGGALMLELIRRAGQKTAV